jgi:hypothetical protein
MKPLRIHAVLFLLLLGACAPTPVYGPATESGPGYSQTALDATRWRVRFQGNSRLGREEVENAALLRAAELTMEQGGRWFRLVRLESGSETRTRPLGLGLGVGVGPARGNVGVGASYEVGGGATSMRWSALADIALLTGPQPGDPAVFDAAELAARLGPSVRGR